MAEYTFNVYLLPGVVVAVTTAAAEKIHGDDTFRPIRVSTIDHNFA